MQAQSSVETGAEILERHPSGKLDDLRVAEVEVQPCRQFVRDPGRDQRGFFGILEDGAFALIVKIALVPTAYVAHFLWVDPGIHSLEVSEVCAPRAPDEHSRLLDRQPPQRGIELLPTHLHRCLERTHGHQHPGVVRGSLCRFDHLPEPPFGIGPGQSGDDASRFCVQGYMCHVNHHLSYGKTILVI